MNGEVVDLWYVQQDGSNEIGPVEADLLIQGIKLGTVLATARVRREGSAEWSPLVEHPLFAGAVRELNLAPDGAPATTQGPAQAQFDVSANGNVVGPVSLDQVRRGYELGKIPKDALVRPVGSTGWQTIKDAIGDDPDSPPPERSAAAATAKPPLLLGRGRMVVGIGVGVALLAVGGLVVAMKAATSKLDPASLDPAAAAEYGLKLYDADPPDQRGAIPFFEKACKGGEPKGCMGLGFANFDGLGGLSKNYALAFELLDPACEKGLLRACRKVATLYYQGWGTQKDPERARSLWRRACEGGEARGCDMLGVMYTASDAPPEWHDVKLGLAMFRKACDGGYSKACDEAKEVEAGMALSSPSVPAASASSESTATGDPAESVCSTYDLEDFLHCDRTREAEAIGKPTEMHACDMSLERVASLLRHMPSTTQQQTRAEMAAELDEQASSVRTILSAVQDRSAVPGEDTIQRSFIGDGQSVVTSYKNWATLMRDYDGSMAGIASEATKTAKLVHDLRVNNGVRLAECFRLEAKKGAVGSGSGTGTKDNGGTDAKHPLPAAPNPNAPCSEVIGAAAARRLVEQCRQVTPGTLPQDCDPQVSCDRPIGHIKFMCSFLSGKGRGTMPVPAFCSDYESGRVTNAPAQQKLLEAQKQAAETRKNISSVQSHPTTGGTKPCNCAADDPLCSCIPGSVQSRPTMGGPKPAKPCNCQADDPLCSCIP